MSARDGAGASRSARPDVDHIIFSDSPDLGRPVSEMADELAQGLSAADAAFLHEAAEELSGRLKPKRFAHSISVARTCKRFAQIYGVDVSKATRAGLVHDWDKCYRGDEVFDRVLEVGLELPPDYEHMGPLFHALTGARALAERFPQLEPDVLQAIARHTSGAIDMQPLDIVVYTADMIEPTRVYEALVPLRELVGQVSLDDLFAECFRATVEHLVAKRRFMHPETAEIWNTWVAGRR